MIGGKKWLALTLLFIVTLAAVVTTGTTLAQAHEADSHSALEVQQETQKQAQEKQRELEKKRQEKIQQNQKKLDEAKQAAETKQAEAKQKICERYREKFKTRHEHIKTVAEQISSRIDRRVENAKSFVAKNNLTVAGYDGLLSDIASRKQSVATAREQIASAVSGFDCESEGRKVQQAAVREQVEAYKAAIKAYRDSVKTFLRAVKTAAQDQLQSESVGQNSSNR